jgi:hypothetical protein
MPSSEEINSQDSVLSQASVTAIQQRFHNWPSVRDVSPQVTKPLRTDIEEGCCLNVNISLLWSYSKEFSSMWICECWEQFSSSPGGDFHRVILFEAFTNITVLDWVLQLCVYGDEETWLDICTPVSKSEDIDLKCLLPCTSTDFKLGVKISGWNLLP